MDSEGYQGLRIIITTDMSHNPKGKLKIAKLD